MSSETSAKTTTVTNGTNGDATKRVPGPPPIVTVNGEQFVKFRVSVSSEQHVHNLRHMPMRDDDVMIAAYPKSGTHWLWEVVHMLTSRKAEYEKREKTFLMLEYNEVERFAELPSPRIINSHMFLRHLSRDIETDRRVRVLHVLRNPKDVAVSFYHHLKQVLYFPDRTFQQWVQDMLTGSRVPGSSDDYFAYLAEMEKWERENPDVPFMNLYFEDMKESPVDTVRRLGVFLGVETSPSLCADIAEACSFHNLKQADVEHKTEEFHVFKEIFQGPPQFYRKGEVGDWKNHFTVALSEQFDAVIAERLKDCAYVKKFRYTL